jgi:hypothetical protein
VKENYKKEFPNAPLFQCRNEEWFYELSGLLEDEVCRRLIEDGDELNPNKSKANQREEHKDGIEYGINVSYCY